MSLQTITLQNDNIPTTCCWQSLILEERVRRGDDTPLVTTLTDDELSMPFDSGYGGEEGVPFTAWSDTRVYFPACYDGSEGVVSVPRNPDEDDKTDHIGG